MEGWKIFAFKEKLRLLKERLKEWNSRVFGNLDNKISSLVAQLNESDNWATNRVLNEVEVNNKNQILEDIWDLQNMK